MPFQIQYSELKFSLTTFILITIHHIHGWTNVSKTKWFAIAVVRFPLEKKISSTTFANMIKPPKSNTHECIVNWIHDIFEFSQSIESGWMRWIEERKKKICGSNSSNNNKQNHRPFQMFFNLMQFGGEIRKWDMENSFAIHMYVCLSIEFERRKNSELFWKRAQKRK